MKFLVMSYALAALAAQSVDGTEMSVKPLQLQPKAALAAAPAHRDAPFVTPPPVAQDLVAPRAMRHEERSRSSCQSDHDLCYDPSSGGHIVYKPARQFMPDIPGLRPENISVRRDKIVFRYSF